MVKSRVEGADYPSHPQSKKMASEPSEKKDSPQGQQPEKPKRLKVGCRRRKASKKLDYAKHIASDSDAV